MQQIKLLAQSKFLFLVHIPVVVIERYFLFELEWIGVNFFIDHNFYLGNSK